MTRLLIAEDDPEIAILLPGEEGAHGQNSDC